MSCILSNEYYLLNCLYSDILPAYCNIKLELYFNNIIAMLKVDVFCLILSHIVNESLLLYKFISKI